ncbi:MAG: hypothetical protein GEV00_12275 [Actinophytocola sp.]|nr:hypothetical protein [Actinophytocola sp.]
MRSASASSHHAVAVTVARVAIVAGFALIGWFVAAALLSTAASAHERPDHAEASKAVEPPRMAGLVRGLTDTVTSAVDKTTDDVTPTVDKTTASVTDTVTGTVDKTISTVNATVDATIKTVNDSVDSTVKTVTATVDDSTGVLDDSAPAVVEPKPSESAPEAAPEQAAATPVTKQPPEQHTTASARQPVVAPEPPPQPTEPPAPPAPVPTSDDSQATTDPAGTGTPGVPIAPSAPGSMAAIASADTGACKNPFAVLAEDAVAAFGDHDGGRLGHRALGAGIDAALPCTSPD